MTAYVMSLLHMQSSPINAQIKLLQMVCPKCGDFLRVNQLCGHMSMHTSRVETTKVEIETSLCDLIDETKEERNEMIKMIERFVDKSFELNGREYEVLIKYKCGQEFIECLKHESLEIVLFVYLCR